MIVAVERKIEKLQDPTRNVHCNDVLTFVGDTDRHKPRNVACFCYRQSGKTILIDALH